MINKFSNPEIFQELDGNKPVKSANIDSVKIPLFNNQPDSLKKKIQALVDKIVAWWNSKVDTKAFLTALGEGLTNNYNKITLTT